MPCWPRRMTLRVSRGSCEPSSGPIQTPGPLGANFPSLVRPNNVYLGPDKNATPQFLLVYHPRSAMPPSPISRESARTSFGEVLFAKRLKRTRISRILTWGITRCRPGCAPPSRRDSGQGCRSWRKDPLPAPLGGRLGVLPVEEFGLAAAGGRSGVGLGRCGLERIGSAE